MNYIGVSRPILSWLGQSEYLEALMPGPGQAQRNGSQVASAIDEVRASVPWSFLLGSMSLLGSHDTARWHSIAGSTERARIGAGLMMTLPGAPCFFYGDEIALTGPNNELARRPMPWGLESEWDREQLEHYRMLTRLRSSSRALAFGGLRWVEREKDSLTFLRESTDERLLIRATRAKCPPVRIPARWLGASSLEPLYGNPSVTVGDDEVVIACDGASFSVLALT